MFSTYFRHRVMKTECTSISSSSLVEFISLSSSNVWVLSSSINKNHKQLNLGNVILMLISLF